MVTSELYAMVERKERYNVVQQFFSAYGPVLEPVEKYYAYSDKLTGQLLFETELFDEMFDYMMKTTDGFQYFYFKKIETAETDLIGGMVVFNEDDTMLVGLLVPYELEQHYHVELQANFGTTIFCCYYVPPPRNRKEILAIL